MRTISFATRVLITPAFVVACLFLAPAWSGAEPPPASSSATSTADQPPEKDKEEFLELYGMFAEAVAQVELNYARPVERRALFESALQGMLKNLDPYSRYIEPERFARYKAEIRAQRDGVGLELGLREEQVIVRGVVPGSPAAEQGVMPGWPLMEVNRQVLEPGDLAAAEALLEESIEAGTVTLTLVTNVEGDGSAVKKVALEATKIRQPTVLPALGLGRELTEGWTAKSLVSEAPKIGQLTITTFGTATAAELEAACQSLMDAGVEGLVLDLRFNAGGLLQSAVEVADLFLESGKILSTEGRTSQRREWNAETEGTLPSLPLVVLVNGYSASASEVVAACLQDHGRATLVGSRTWGKGSVQNVVELESGKSGLKLTTALYQRPSGANIHRFAGATEGEVWGVSPEASDQVAVTNDQQKALIAARRALLRRAVDSTSSSSAARLEDPQQQRAIAVLKEKLRAATK